jgi:hypothetical protein
MLPETTPQAPKPRSRTPFTVVGTVSAVLAAGFLVGGGALAWADHEKDDQGYLTTRTHQFTARTAALATQNLDVNLAGADWVVSENHLGKVRLKVAPENGKPVFVGIARTSDVSDYLRGVSHTTVTDVDYSPFKAKYREVAGAPRADRPAGHRIWAASAQGAERQTVTWKVQEGDWSVVVMNADGSPGVRAGISAGANLPFLTPLVWGTLGTGGLLAAAAAGLILVGTRSPRRRSTSTTTPAPAAG